MGKRSLRPCAAHRCTNLTREKYCDTHKQQFLERERERAANAAKEYDEQKRNQKSYTFYHSAAWRECRKAVLERDNYLCQQCLRDKKIKHADMVHHKKELSTHWYLRLNMDNLESLCNECHNKIHKTKRVG